MTTTVTICVSGHEQYGVKAEVTGNNPVFIVPGTFTVFTVYTGRDIHLTEVNLTEIKKE